MSQKVLQLLSWFPGLLALRETRSPCCEDTQAILGRGPHAEGLKPPSDSQANLLATRVRAVEADPASAKPSSDGNIDSHSTATSGETLSQNFSAKPQKVGDNKCLLLFQVIKFGVFLLNSKTQLTYISSILGQKTHGSIYYINIYYL